MKIKIIVLVMMCSLMATSLTAQKIKYKDLFPILDAKNYEEAGPQLLQYLSNPKNQDEANPNLQMGFMLEDRFLKMDVVADSLRVFQVGDSSILYLNRAKSLIDEKELKKRDEYYQAFFRRDLRTGEFGIKVSDVHLDIEKKIESINARMESVHSLSRQLLLMKAARMKAGSKYRNLVEEYTLYNTLLIAADEETQQVLREIEEAGRTALESAEALNNLSVELGATRFAKGVEAKDIVQFGIDGISAPAKEEGMISLWDFESWGRTANSEILGGVSLFKSMVYNYSQDIREKKKLIKASKEAGIDTLSAELDGQFATYDPQSTAKKLLQVEMYEAKVMKQIDLQLNPALLDSSLIGSQLQIFEGAYADAKNMQEIAYDITSDDLDLMKKKYRKYAESFFQEYVTASKYISDMQAWSDRNVRWLGDAVAFWTEKNKWGTVSDEDGLETSYPLFEQEVPDNGLMTMSVPVKNADEAVIYGANMQDGIGYIKGFGPDRYEKWALEYPLPVDGAARLKSDTIPTVDGAMGFYVYNTISQENNFVVVSFNPEGQLNWATTVSLAKDPVDFKFDDLTQELTILLYPEEQLPLDTDELGYIVIDRTGNAR